MMPTRCEIKERGLKKIQTIAFGSVSLIGAFITSTLLLGCIGDVSEMLSLDNSKSESGTPYDLNASAVRYFGYAFSGPYIDEVKDHTNLVHISSDFRNQTDLQYLAQARQDGLMVALDLSSVFFPGGRGDFTLERVQNSSRWATYAARIAPYLDIIAAFYPVDEPYWVFGQPNGNLTNTEIAAVLTALNLQIKQRFPQIPIAVVFAYPSVDDSLIIPQSYDWVGFDCYDGFDACGNPSLLRRSVPEFLGTLREKKTAGQRLILIPPAFQQDLAMSEAQIVAIVDRYQQVAATDPEVVAVVPFLWPDIVGDNLAGRSMASVAHKYRQLGASLLGKGTPGLAPVPSSIAAPRVVFRGTDGSAKYLFNLDIDALVGTAEGVTGDQLYWCLTLNDQGSCLTLDLDPGGNWSEVQTTSPAWMPASEPGSWTLTIPQASLQRIGQSKYIVHLYDPTAHVRSMPHVIRLAEPPKAIFSATVDGPDQTVFHKADAIFFRVHYPLKAGLHICAEFQGTNQCTGAPGNNTSWGAIPGPDEGWNYDTETQDWTSRIASGGIVDYPSGTYLIHFFDGGSGFQSSYPIQLVD